jgi:hypothetical protein
VNVPKARGLAGPVRKVMPCGEGWADAGRAGPTGPNPKKDSNEILIFEFQLNLDLGKTWRNSSRRFRRNLDMWIFPKFF